MFPLVLLCCISPIFSLPEHPFNLQMSLGTAVKFYGDENVVQYREEYFSSDSSRFILNTEVATSFFIDDYVSLDLGGIISFDLFKHDYYTGDGRGSIIKDSMFLLDYDIFFGVRVYPLMVGFSLGVDYITGGYMNFMKISDASSKENGGWSNGFRLIFEYNILNNRIGWSPAVGLYWQNMSRRGGHDNIIGVYIKAALR